jgi:hypothetical protein
MIASRVAPETRLREPASRTATEAWRSWIRGLISAERFTARRFSWVCVQGPYFLKIPRLQGVLEVDFEDGNVEAEHEYQLTRQLAERLDEFVDTPLRLVDGCIVMRRLHGPDLWSLAKEKGDSLPVRAGIARTLVLAARLHRLGLSAIPDLPEYDYAKDPWVPSSTEPHGRVCERPRTIVLTGLEVRNFKQASVPGAWKFFDPHTAALGVPEDDVARLVLSLLMIRWGRNPDCRIWTAFDFHQLMQVYEKESGAPLDKELLASMFQRNIAWRRYEARCMARVLPSLVRAAALAYERLFFWQVRRWGDRHGL